MQSKPNVQYGQDELNRWHIHVDGTKMNRDFQSFLEALGFTADNFIRGSGQYAPECHMTWKGKNRDIRLYKQHMAAIRSFLESHDFTPQPTAGSHRQHVYNGGDPNIFLGYVEGEYIPLDADVPEKDFDPSVLIPFRVKMHDLLSGFRESEVHVSVDQKTTDPRLIDALHKMGMYDVLMPKPKEGNRIALILTVQSASRKQMSILIPKLHDYLRMAGGAKMGSIKEERIADWISSHPDVSVPPVIGDVEYK